MRDAPSTEIKKHTCWRVEIWASCCGTWCVAFFPVELVGWDPFLWLFYNIVGEMKRGLGGYIYVKCQNVDCGEINCVPPPPPPPPPPPHNLTEWVGPGNAGEMHQVVVFASSPHFLCAKNAGIRALWDKIQQCRVKYQRFSLLFSPQSMLLQVLVFYGPSTLVRSFQAWSVILSTLFLGKPPTQFTST